MMSLPELGLRLALWFLLRLGLLLLPAGVQAERDGARLSFRVVALIGPLMLVVAAAEQMLMHFIERVRRARAERRLKFEDPGDGPSPGPPCGAHP